MSYWNHRVIKRTYPATATTEECVEFNIHEVFYNKDDAICSWTSDPMSPSGNTLEELIKDVEWFAGALAKPVLDENWLEENCASNEFDEETETDSENT